MKKAFSGKLLKSGLAGALLLLLAGCVSESAANMEHAKALRIGMTKAQVLAIMGEPVKEDFSTPDRWFYFVNPVWMDGLTTEEECMPLIFEKGRLVGWGSRFYAQYRSFNNKVKESSEK
jgi:outer membrane protein assembly factor BamE (lipoprotein component of BamABCDE complex)